MFLAGEQCFMREPHKVWPMLSVTRYKERWPLIAKTGELEASAVTISAPNPKKKGVLVEHLVLLHKRRVTASQAAGHEEAHICFGGYLFFSSASLL